MQQASLLSAAPFGDGTLLRPIDAALEIGAYETLWSKQSASFKSIAEMFAKNVGERPSDFVPENEIGREHV